MRLALRVWELRRSKEHDTNTEKDIGHLISAQLSKSGSGWIRTSHKKRNSHCTALCFHAWAAQVSPRLSSSLSSVPVSLFTVRNACNNKGGSQSDLLKSGCVTSITGEDGMSHKGTKRGIKGGYHGEKMLHNPDEILLHRPLTSKLSLFSLRPLLPAATTYINSPLSTQMRSSPSPSTMDTRQSTQQWPPAPPQSQYNPPYHQNISYIQRQQHQAQHNQQPPCTGNSTPTPPQSTSSATSSPGMPYTALHHASPYAHPLPSMSPHMHPQGQPMFPYHQGMGPYPQRRPLPPQQQLASPQQQQLHLQQQQQQQQQPQQPQSQHSSPASSPAKPPVRTSPLAHPQNVHSDVYYAPNAAMLYNHANALAAAQAQGQNGGAPSDLYAGGSTPPRLPPILQVEKQQVTTSATQAASASRRRNEAHFVCPVPGCGSTFTRRFNLRGTSDFLTNHRRVTVC